MRLASPSPLPGFGTAFGLTLTWVSLIVLIPLAALVLRPWELGIAGVVDSLSGTRVMAALRLSFGAALAAAAIDVPLGLLIAWVLVRGRFPGRRLLDSLVDLPFALPTAVAGIALTAIYASNGWVGSWLAPIGVNVAYALPGIMIALMFVGLPYVVRTVQPVLMDLAADVEEAAATLGARPAQVFWRIVLPAIAPAAMTGFAMAFARAVGEYGSVIFIAGNMPGQTEIAPLLIVIRLEQFDYAGAAALALAMLVLAFLILGTVNLLQQKLFRAAR
ncbi:sulfate ABC transporter permease subunit CysT [Rhodovastum atsumiense]|uniref:Sulfate transport system permease protein CysT n=1 Tax=Rhodovastum atsumiense TaxID=504468 RepID=A0A5M6IKW3_9PROT|nr:sulfate ABC transporter permease subunit CysT [Rhodovastum atsumiense]KAA5608557.1 sulfate ABC transporter permease subunit CysT [Rhodovastum atsumiense]